MADCGHSHGHGGDHGHSHGSATHGPGDDADVAHAHIGGLSDLSALASSLPNADTPEAQLAVDFSRAELLFHHIDDGAAMDCNDHDINRHSSDSLAAFLACARTVRQQALFSDNESVDDIKTEDVRYLMIEYYIATLKHKYNAGSPAGTATIPVARLAVLKDARAGLESFLERCITLGVAGPNEAEALGMKAALAAAQKADAEEEAAMTGSGRAGRPAPGSGPQLGRGSKIERFKRNLAAKKRLAELAAIHAREAALMARSGGVLSDGVGGAASSFPGGGDDSTRREAALLSVQIALRQCVDDLDAIRQEIPILRHAASVASDAGSAAGGPGAGHGHARAGAMGLAQGRYASEQQDDRLDPSRRRGPPAGDLSIDPHRPGLQVTHIDPTFAVTRETVKASVFNNPHRPPTLGLEDWGEQVLDMTKERDALEAERNKTRPKTLAELREAGVEMEDDEGAYDIATDRERRMDEWKDGVPKGMGNTKRI